MFAATQDHSTAGVLFLGACVFVLLVQWRFKRGRYRIRRSIRRIHGGLDPQRNFTTRQRRRIYARDGGLCRYCLLLGIETHVHFGIDCQDHGCIEDFEADHATPHCRGGLTTIPNGLTSCRYHNRAKGDLTYEEFTGRAFAEAAR